MILYDGTTELHIRVADLPSESDDFLPLLESLIDYDDTDWQAEIDRIEGRKTPLFNTYTKPLTDEVPF